MTQMFNYTVDMPYLSPKQNTDNFYKLPRSVLLPPYLASNQYFVDFLNQIDFVFDPTIEQPLYALSKIRNMWVFNKESMAKVNNAQMIDFSEWGGPDQGTVANQVTMLGLDLSTAEIVDDNSYRALSRFIGQYWYDKGKQSAIDFMNFCLGTNLKLTPLWTQDYKTFVPKSSIPAGATYIGDAGRPNISQFYPVYRHSTVGGWIDGSVKNSVGKPLRHLATPNVPVDNPWWPTTHVSIKVTYPSVLQAESIGNFFYEIANENLVLHEISTEADTNVGTILLGAGGNNNSAVGVRSAYYPLMYHSRVGGILGGGITGGVGQPLQQATTSSM